MPFMRKKMSSFKEIREFILICFADNVLSDEEFLVLWESCQSKNPDFPWDNYNRFTIEDMDDAECKAEFRVHKRDLPMLAESLGIPASFKCRQRTVCN